MTSDPFHFVQSDAPPAQAPCAPEATDAWAFAALLERASLAGCWTWSPDAAPAVLCWTPALPRLLRWPTHAQPGWLTPLDLLAPESRGPADQALQALQPGQHADLQLQALAATGERVDVRLLVQCGESTQGRLLMAVVQDISARTALERESRRVTAQLSNTLASMTEAFATLDREGRLTYANAQTCMLLGRSPAQLLGRRLWRELDDEGTGQLRQRVLGALARQRSEAFEDFYLPLHKWLELRLYPYADGLAVYLHDVSERRREQEELLLLKTSISRLNDVVLIAETTAEHGPRIVFANDAFTRLTGYSLDEVRGRNPRLLRGPLTQRSEVERIGRSLQRWEPVRAELIAHKKSGESFWLELEVVPVEESPRGIKHWVAVGRDISARKAQDDAIEHLAFYDTLTQLPNRYLLMERLEQALSAPGTRARHGALMFIDLDHFKVLNDTLGHARGDMLLQLVAQRLSQCVRPHDTVARLGGDEFVVLLDHLAHTPEQAHTRAQRMGEHILQALSQPYDLAGHPFHGTCSVGITPFRNRQESIGELLKQADLAMYQAKAAGRNGLCFFDPAMQAAATAQAALTAELRQALREQRFVLHYQPQVNGQGQMVGVEALVRWQRGPHLAGPQDFITAAEDSGLIMPL